MLWRGALAPKSQDALGDPKPQLIDTFDYFDAPDGRRAQWSMAAYMLPESVFATLMALSEGEMDRFEIAAATGFNDGYLGLISNGMRSRGWIGTHGRGGGRIQFGGKNRWWITERGKIILAIECGRRTKARAKGRLAGYDGAEPVRRYRYAWSAAERALGL